MVMPGVARLNIPVGEENLLVQDRDLFQMMRSCDTVAYQCAVIERMLSYLQCGKATQAKELSLSFYGLVNSSSSGAYPQNSHSLMLPASLRQSAIRTQVPSLICRAVFSFNVMRTESPALSSKDFRTVP